MNQSQNCFVDTRIWQTQAGSHVTIMFTEYLSTHWHIQTPIVTYNHRVSPSTTVCQQRTRHCPFAIPSKNTLTPSTARNASQPSLVAQQWKLRLFMIVYVYVHVTHFIQLLFTLMNMHAGSCSVISITTRSQCGLFKVLYS